MLATLSKCLLWLAYLLASVGHAASSYTSDQGTQVEWISESSTLRPGQTHWLGLKITPAPGWHTYWRNPGAAGLVTRLDVQKDPAVILGGLRWPAPQAKVFDGLNIYGYESSVLLAMPAVLVSHQSIELKAQARWMVCQTLCIPEQAELTLTLQPGEGTPSVYASEFAQARAQWPAKDALSGRWDASGRMQVSVPPGAQGGRWAFFPYANDIWPAEFYQVVRAFDGRVVFDAPASQPWPKGELVNLDARQSWRVDFESAPVSVSWTGLWMALGAFAGGIILNLMPCVFPVLAIKAAGVMNMAGAERRHRRMRGHVFALGVVVSFVVLGLVLSLLQWAGAAIGWGFQLQSPWFVGLMAALMLALAASMLGIFKLGSSLMGAGQQLTQRQGYSGDFWSGVLAVLVASPCTAPFMGPALGFALASSSAVMFGILLALAVGFALPMWAIHAFDSVAQRLPRPGAWMQRLQEGLAFPMIGTAAWLIWILLSQLGISTELWWLMLPVVAAFAMWSWRRQLRGTGAVVTLAAAWAFWPAQAEDSVAWKVFSHSTLEQLIQSPEPVLVNVTADWCISCLSNERLVFSDPEIAQMDVHFLKADWTEYDPDITAYLDRFNRAGVPLYVVYSQGEVAVLPQILTVPMVKQALGADE